MSVKAGGRTGGAGSFYAMSGQITVFLSMLLCLALGVIGALLEAARYAGARMLTAAFSEGVTDSVFSEYDRLLLERYDVLFLDAAYNRIDFSPGNLSERAQEYGAYYEMPQKGVFGTYSRLWNIRMEDADVEQYVLATDDGAKSFRRQAADYMRERLGTDLLQHFLELATKGSNPGELEEALRQRERQSEENLSAQEEIERERRQMNPGQTEQTPTPEQEKWRANNPITVIRELKERGILALVLPGCELSAYRRSLGLLPSHRALQVGTGIPSNEEISDTVWDRILCNEYYLEKFSHAADYGNGGAFPDDRFAYQIEYLLSGGESDQENLKGAVHQMLLMREAANYMYLLSDQVKQLEAETAAWAIAGVTAAFPFMQAIKQGILLAWAYGESILDMRVLLTGGAVPIMKTGESFRLSIDHLAVLLQPVDTGWGQTEDGLHYEDYLRMLMYFKDEKEMAMRALDLIEMDIQGIAGGECFMADHLIAGVKLKFKYVWEPLFCVGLPADHSFGKWRIGWSVPYSY
ncbi:MAG: DUF5702 domain-containing protein [Lachnospiraceae bacterium]